MPEVGRQDGRRGQGGDEEVASRCASVPGPPGCPATPSSNPALPANEFDGRRRGADRPRPASAAPPRSAGRPAGARQRRASSRRRSGVLGADPAAGRSSAGIALAAGQHPCRTGGQRRGNGRRGARTPAVRTGPSRPRRARGLACGRPSRRNLLRRRWTRPATPWTLPPGSPRRCAATGCKMHGASAGDADPLRTAPADADTRRMLAAALRAASASVVSGRGPCLTVTPSPPSGPCWTASGD